MICTSNSCAYIQTIYEFRARQPRRSGDTRYAQKRIEKRVRISQYIYMQYLYRLFLLHKISSATYCYNILMRISFVTTFKAYRI